MVTTRDNRDQIIDAAGRLFGSRGYASVTISQICEASGLPVGSVYHYFGSKSGVLRAVLERGQVEFFAALPGADDLLGTPGERLNAYYEAAANLIAERLPLFRLMVSLQLHSVGDHETRTIVSEAQQRSTTLMAAFIEPVARGYGVPDPDACASELAVLNMIYTAGIVAMAGTADKVKDGIRDLHRLVLASILQRTACAPPAG